MIVTQMVVQITHFFIRNIGFGARKLIETRVEVIGKRDIM